MKKKEEELKVGMKVVFTEYRENPYFTKPVVITLTSFDGSDFWTDDFPKEHLRTLWTEFTELCVGNIGGKDKFTIISDPSDE